MCPQRQTSFVPASRSMSRSISKPLRLSCAGALETAASGVKHRGLTRIRYCKDIVCNISRSRPMFETKRCAVARRGLGLALLIFPILVSPSMAQTWPQRPVKFIVTLGPGSGVDFGTRLLGDRLSKRWGQPVVIENPSRRRRGCRRHRRHQRERRSCPARLSDIRADRASVRAAADALPG
jgi:hypothetical protein